jgi:hypothetical protein
MALFLPRLNVYEQMLALDVDVFLSSLSSGDMSVSVRWIGQRSVLYLDSFFVSGNLSSSVVAS